MTSLPGAALLIAEMVALLLAVTFGVALLQRRLGDAAIRRWMGGPPRRAALKGIAVGFITPFCTYSAIPVLLGMRQAGVRPGGYAAFIFAAPVVDPVMIGVLAIIIGPTGAAVYVTTAFAAAFLLALIVDTVDIARHLKPVPALVGSPAPASSLARPGPSSPPASCSSPEEVPWSGWREESRAAWRRAVALLRSMAWLIAAGVGVGLAIGLLVPTDALAGIAGADNPLAVPAAAAAGIPLYFGTELFIPIGDALHAKGAGTGAIVALVIAGAGANIPEFALLTKIARGRVVAAFFAYVFAVAVVAGLLTDLIL
ncbi:MAG: permease [Acidimicrobiaceae bacterium]|nr:permease [Acidimicrobiaceae bacterium]